ncbi:hypothetical protein CRG98_022588 [Punica granatum]|uniref:Uncharacterized protein n=1 Tax=Punica granatum TaxID=22663 RepID=A0A2I0JLC8_PUNGR|nr:hypothetical protein CRG98_022588 [Punica granatum]
MAGPEKKKIVRAGRAALAGCPRSPPARRSPKSRISAIPPKSAEILTEKRKRLQLNRGKYNSKGDEQDPVREIEKLALVWGNFEIGDFGNPHRKTRLFPSIPAVSTPAKSKSDTAQPKWCPKPSPEPLSRRPGARIATRSPVAAAPPDPGRPLANGHRPISFASQVQPRSSAHFGPTSPIRPSALPDGFLLWAGHPIRPDSSGDFFYFYKEAPQLFELGKFLT